MEMKQNATLAYLDKRYVNEEKMRFLMGPYIRFAQVNFIIVIKILKNYFLNGRRLVMN